MSIPTSSVNSNSSTHSFELTACLFPVEGDPGAISNPDGYQDALSKKQRRPQEEERRRKEQGPSVSRPQARLTCF